jgi:hypothetical protein
MRIRFMTFAPLLVLAPVLSSAQAARLDLPSFAHLEKKAEESVDISLDASLLRLAGRFMDTHDRDEAAAKDLINGLQGIYVRSYEFATDHAYSQDDIERVRSQLAAPGWSRLVKVHSRKQDEDVDVYLRQTNGRVEGLVVIAAEPREFTIVNIVGSVDLEKLRLLEGKFGVPKLGLHENAAGPTGLTDATR